MKGTGLVGVSFPDKEVTNSKLDLNEAPWPHHEGGVARFVPYQRSSQRVLDPSKECAEHIAELHEKGFDATLLHAERN